MKNKKIGGGGFHHVAAKVADFDRAVAFYKEGLGCSEALAWGEGDQRAIMLDTGDGNYIELFAGGKQDTASEARLLHFALRTRDCDAAHATALAAGATERLAPKDVQVHGRNGDVSIRISFVVTPTGEVVEFFQSDF